jgi:hypothetical protein
MKSALTRFQFDVAPRTMWTMWSQSGNRGVSRQLAPYTADFPRELANCTVRT